jgi:uncharacterized protein (DUF1499 family)
LIAVSQQLFIVLTPSHLQWYVMRLPDLRRSRSASTIRTYPVVTEELVRVVEEAVQSLPRWMLTHAGESKVRAVRKTRVFGFEDDVTVRITPAGSSGASTNTWAELESAAGVGRWDLGQNERNLKELLAAIERRLTADS